MKKVICTTEYGNKVVGVGSDSIEAMHDAKSKLASDAKKKSCEFIVYLPEQIISYKIENP